MIRTTCPKCGREGAVADYLAPLPILCNGCGTRVTVGDRIATSPLFPPPVAPSPPKAVTPPPAPPKPPAPPQKKTKPRVPPPLIEAKNTPLPPPPPPEPDPELIDFVAASPVFFNTDPTTAFPGVEESPDPADLPPDDEPLAPAPAPVPPTEPQPATPRAVPAVSPKPAPPTAAEPPFPLPLAGVGRRLFARFLFLLGLAMMVGLGFAVLMIVPNSVKRDTRIMWAIVAAFPLIYLLVNAAMLARTGQDVGKRYAGIRVVNADGGKATEVTALLKRDALTLVIALTGVGLLYWLIDFFTLFGKGGRCLHDRIAGTRVVRA